jgi:hypothetical protein
MRTNFGHEFHIPNKKTCTYQHVSGNILFKDVGIVAGILAGIQNAMVKCLFIVNRSCIDNGF